MIIKEPSHKSSDNGYDTHNNNSIDKKMLVIDLVVILIVIVVPLVKVRMITKVIIRIIMI